MEIKRGPAVILGVLVVTAVVLFIVLSGGDDDSSSTNSTSATDNTEPAVIQIKDGEPVGGVQDLTFTEGDDIRFTVKSDQAWEIHFHGYDIAKDVKAGGKVSYDVPGTISGVFEVEIEDTATQIAQITVNPG